MYCGKSTNRVRRVFSLVLKEKKTFFGVLATVEYEYICKSN